MIDWQNARNFGRFAEKFDDQANGLFGDMRFIGAIDVLRVRAYAASANT